MEDEGPDYDTHLCLTCNQTIIGLMNYVIHKKSQCQKRRSLDQSQHQQQQQTRGHNDILGETSRSYGLPREDSITLSSLQQTGDYSRRARGYNFQQDAQNPATPPFTSAQNTGGQPSANTGLSVDVTSPLSSFIDSAFSPGGASPVDPDAVLRSPEPPSSMPDFFQSLELKSISGRDACTPGPQSKTGKLKRRGVQEDALDLDLPITMILSNLDFSSDEENGVVGFPSEDESEVSDSEPEWSSSPPKTHTGGKWKPGQGPPKNYHPHGPVGGKWKPGQRPQEPRARKGGRSAGVKYTKPFFCNTCKAAFPNRFSYSVHFESKSHKDAVLVNETSGKEQQAEDDSEMVLALDPSTGEFRETAPEPDSDSVSQASLASSQSKKLNYCKTCELYFDSAYVYNVHCETKKHKGNVEKLNRDLQRELLGTEDSTGTFDKATELGGGVDDGSKSIESSEQQPSEMSKGDLPEVHFCVVCRKSFKRKYEMARHLLTHFHKQRAMRHPKALEMLDKYNKYVIRLCPFQCNICQFYFNRASDLLDHLHTPGHQFNCNDLVGPLLCVTCKYKTHSPDLMLQHVQSSAHRQAVASNHHVCIIKECHSKITCKFCGVQMHSAVRMKRHIDSRHKNRKEQEQLQVRTSSASCQMQCPHCNKTFRNRSGLFRHYSTHLSNHPYKCDICTKSFSELRRLEAHFATPRHQRTAKLVGKKRGVTEVVYVEDELDTGEDTSMSVGESQDVSGSSGQPRRSGRPRKPKDFGSMFDRGTQSKKRILKGEEPADSPAQSVEADVDDEECDADNCAPLKLSVEEVKTDTADVKAECSLNSDKPSNSTCLQGGDEYAEDILDASDTEGSRVQDPNFTFQSKPAKCKGTGVITCEHCDFCGNDLQDLKSHYMEEHPSHIIICTPCDQFFLSQKAYRIHCAGGQHQARLRNLGPDKMELKTCPHCGKKFSEDEAYELHVEFVHLHISTEEAVQRVCQGRDMVTQLYGEHLRQLDKISPNSSVACPECGRFVMKYNLIEHLRVHTRERPFKCRHCTKDFGSRISLRRHLLEHIGKKAYTCETCGKVLRRRGAYIFHMRLHVSEKKGLKFDCDVCGVSFRLESQLVHHKKRHGDRKFKCTAPGCNWAFVLKTELEQHKITHSGERKFLCDICGWAAPNTNRLRRHAKTHQPPQVLPCEYCPYKAGNKTHLKRHMRIHIGAKPFKCLYCSYACNTHENMRKHILKTRKHQGLKIYPCKFCDFQSNEAKEFKSHLMVDHFDYYKARPSESLVRFTGLYHPEEDVTKPPEGGEIHQVMKGRFIKVYDGTRVGGTGDPVRPPRPHSGGPKKKRTKSERQTPQPPESSAPASSSSSLEVDPVSPGHGSKDKIPYSDDQLAMMTQVVVKSSTTPVSLVSEPQQQEQLSQQPITFPPQAETDKEVYPRGLPWTVVAQENRGGVWCQSLDVVVPQSIACQPAEAVPAANEVSTGTAYIRGPGGDMQTIVTMVNVDSQTFQQIQSSGFQVIATGGTTAELSQ